MERTWLMIRVLIAATVIFTLTQTGQTQGAPVDYSQVYQDVRGGAVRITAKLVPGADEQKLGQDTAELVQFLKSFSDSLSQQQFQPIRVIDFWQSWYERFNAVHNSFLEMVGRRGQEGNPVYNSIGIVVDRDGLIVSSNASILCSTSVMGLEVYDANQTVYDATVTAVDTITNIALVKAFGARFDRVISITPAVELPPAGTPIFSIQHCYTPKQMTPVPGTIGNSGFNGYGYQLNVLRAYHEEYFQALMSVYHDSEGAPIFDLQGNLLGLLALDYRLAPYPGVAFAVPDWMVADVATDLILYGKRERGGLGLEFDWQTLKVTGVEKGGAAERAGIEVGDIIESFNGVPINSGIHLFYQVLKTRPNQHVQIRVRRQQEGRQIVISMDNTVSNSGI